MRGWATATRSRSALVACAVALALALGGGRARADEDESELYVAEGRAALRRGDYDRAARALDRALAVNPRRVEAYVLRAGVHAARKEYAAGVALMRRAQALAPESREVLTTLGTLLLLDGQAAEGVPILERVAATWPDAYEAHALLGHHHAALGDHRRAIASLEAYLRTRPAELATEDAEHAITLADAYLRVGEARTARDLFGRVLGQKPRHLRARLGLAWATAALDCREAMPLLVELSTLGDRHPEVYLVRGRCALLLGRPGEALGLANAYLERRPDGAAGHALRGEAHAASGTLPAARRSLAEALRLEPTNRRWALKLVRVEREGGDPDAAIALLHRIGPAGPLDPEWTVELAEALLFAGRPAEAAAAVGPLVAERPDDAAARMVLGAALLGVGDASGAVVHLEGALALAPASGRATELLVKALNLTAIAALAGGRLDDAEAMLVRAGAVAESPTTWRNLGVVRLAAGRPRDAIAPLARAAEAEDDIALQLLGRALGLSGDVEGARRALEGAATRARRDPARAADVALELAALELEAGQPDRAVATLERALDLGPAGETRRRLERALATALHAAGVDALASRGFARAIKLLERAERLAADQPAAQVAIRCDLALAATAAGDRDGALKRLKALEREKAVCPFPPPADRLAVPILIALNEGLRTGRARAALERLEKLGRQTSGAAERLRSAALRLVALAAAKEAYEAGNLKVARAFLATARAAEGRVPSPETTHNLAVLDLADGRVEAAVAALEAVAAEVPEALVNLGLAREQQGDPLGALELWERAERAGVRFAPLGGWIATRRRVFGLGGTP